MLKKFLDLFKAPEPVREYPNELEERIASITQSLYREIYYFSVEYDSTEDLSQHFDELEFDCLVKRLNMTDICRGGIKSFEEIGIDLNIRPGAAERHYHSGFSKLPDDLKRKYKKLEDMI